MATQKSILTSALAGLAFGICAAVTFPAQAALQYCGSATPDLPCLYNTANQSDNASAIPESSVESAVQSALGQVVDLMLVDRIDFSFWVPNYYNGYNPNGSQSITKTSGDLSVTANSFDYVPLGVGPYGGNYWQAVGGTFAYTGSQALSYITIGTYTSFAVYKASDFLSNNWSTLNLSGWSNKLVHFALWSTKDTQVDEPATLGLLLAGTAFMLWRRRRSVKAA